MPEYSAPSLPKMQEPVSKLPQQAEQPLQTQDSSLPYHSASNSVDSYSSSSSVEQNNAVRPRQNPTSPSRHRSRPSYASIPEVDVPVDPKPAPTGSAVSLDEEFPVRPPPSVLPHTSSAPAIPGMSSNRPPSRPQSRPQSPAASLTNHSPYRSSPGLHPSSAYSLPIPRSVSTPATIANSPYSHQQRNSSANNLAYVQQQYRNSRLSQQPFSSRSSVSSLDFTSPGVVGHERAHSRSHSPADFAPTAAFDLDQSFLTTNLGSNSSTLMPRIKTIELYRKNAKKSNDPLIQFQFAQYMLQTALLSGSGPKHHDESHNSPTAESAAPPATTTPADSSHNLEPPRQPRHRASMMSISSFTAPPPPVQSGPLTSLQEDKIKRDLLKEAVSHLAKLSASGYPDAQYLLGDAYASGALGKSDLRESFLLFKLAAKHGHAEAAYRASLCLEEGWGTSRDPRKAVQFLRQSASKGHTGAMLRLGIACFYGRLGLHMGSSESRGKTQQEGIKWLTRATESANETFPQGPFELAKIYEQGYKDIVFKDLSYAVQLYVKSADLNYVPAASKLGNAYEYGTLGCPQDAALSIHYYTIAALGGDPAAMLAMCAWYMVGAEPMLPRNEEEAYEWASRAAQRGLAKAQYATGYFLENGIGCERDILRSTTLYRKAAAAGDQRAIDRLKTNRDMATQAQTKHRKSERNKKDGKDDGDKKEKDCIIM